MTIDVKQPNGSWAKVEQPFYKISDTQWVPLQRVMHKVDGQWVEVWPSEIVYEHPAGGSGFCVNIWDVMGRPTKPGNYTFVNNGKIGGSRNCYALSTGIFPAGSVLKIVNNGVISGSGGNGAGISATTSSNTSAPAISGGHGILLEFPTFIENNGRIQGGGGGGGMCTEQTGTWYYCAGAGGAGIPAGSKGGNGSSGACYDGTETAGGASMYGTGTYCSGGNPGSSGGDGYTGIGNSDRRGYTEGAIGGCAIVCTDYLIGSTGLRPGETVFGDLVPGVVPLIIDITENSMTFYSANNESKRIEQRFVKQAAAASLSMSGATLLSQSQWRIPMTSQGRDPGGSSGSYTVRVPTFWNRTYSVTMSHGGKSWTRNHRLLRTSAYTYRVTCFLAGTMVTMGDGTTKPIEDVIVGDIVRTPFGVTRVRELDRPLLGDRKLYAMDIDGKCRVSGEHSLWGRNPSTKEEWWITRDLALWRREAAMGAGSSFKPDPVDLEGRIGEEWEFAKIDGWVTTGWHEIEAPDGEDTQLYDLYLDDGGAYFADGYIAKAMWDPEGYDWNDYRHLPGLPKD